MRNPSGPARATAAAMVVLFAAAGCSGDPADAAPAPVASSPAPATATPASVTEPWGNSVTKAPPFPDGKVVAQAANATGGREMEIKGGVGSGILTVLVNCEGKGKLTVAVEPLGVSFPFDCVAGQINAIGNATNMNGGGTRPHTPGTVRVTASAGVRWAITVGRQDASRD